MRHNEPYLDVATAYPTSRENAKNMLEHSIQHQHMDICFSNNESNTNTQHHPFPRC